MHNFQPQGGHDFPRPVEVFQPCIAKQRACLSLALALDEVDPPSRRSYGKGRNFSLDHLPENRGREAGGRRGNPARHFDLSGLQQQQITAKMSKLPSVFDLTEQDVSQMLAAQCRESSGRRIEFQ
jgi:hypothetical protein